MSSGAYCMPGVFLVTICSLHRAPVLGACDRGLVTLSPVGEMCRGELLALPTRWSEIYLDEWVIMPDHLHCILRIHAGLPAGLPQVIGGFKSGVSRLAAARGLCSGSTIWQRGFHDRKLRTTEALESARTYIRRNPMNWR